MKFKMKENILFTRKYAILIMSDQIQLIYT